MINDRAFRRALRNIFGLDRDFGAVQRLSTAELFDAEWYRATQAPEVPPGQAARHYLQEGAARGLSPGPSFDGPWYLANNPDVAAAGLNPLLHYLENGRAEGRPTHPYVDPKAVARIANSDLFDAHWYHATQAPDVAVDQAARHYLQEGASRGLSPGPLFDGPWYLENNRDVATAGLNPLLHYVECGRSEQRPVCPVVDPAALALIAASDLFDAAWYRETQARDIALDRAARHYLQEGAARGLSPGPLFDGAWYLKTNRDVAAAGRNPLLHYLTDGRREGRPICPFADPEALARIEASAYFDAPWYLATYRPELPPDRAARHYLLEGAALGMNPGPLFDGLWYLGNNPDVAEAGLNPLLHYLDSGCAEGRPIALAYTHDACAQAIERRSVILRTSVGAQVVVVIHAFYVDVFEDLLPPLVRAVPNFDLLVSTDEPAKKRAIEAAATRAGLEHRCRVSLVGNRGRNFGPLFTVFAQDILRYDLVLHVHTKKSLFSGAEQVRWRDEIYRALFANSTCAAIALALLEEDRQIGLFFPETSAHIVYWAHTWLANIGTGHGLLARLGLSYDGFDEYLDYPVGGMFWARVDALRPLLMAGLTLDDFPEEHGQTDGTLAHAIERVIPLVCRSQGYRAVCFDYDRGLARYGSSARNWHQYSARTQDQALQALRDVDLVSFDLFDTLVCRPARRPDAVLKLVEHRIAMEEGRPIPLFAERRAAENRVRARRHHQGDVDLSEIYAELAASGPIPRDVVARAHALEKRIDLGALRPRTEVIAVLRAAHEGGKRIVLMTDTYYEEADIRGILREVGIADLFAAVYVSNAIGARKDRGDLWAHVEAVEGVPRTRWLHVGDNEHSDIQAACDRNIRYLHVAHPAKILAQSGFARDEGDLARTWPSDLVVGHAMLHLCGNPFLGRAKRPYLSLGSTREVGYAVFGPLMLLFMSWLIRHEALARVERLYFLAREGDFLVKIYRLIQERYDLKTLPEGRYFYVSRQMAIGAALAKGFRPDLVTEAGRYVGSLQGLLWNRTSFTAPAHLGLDRHDVRLPNDAAVVRRVMSSLEAEIMAHAADLNERFRAYARQEKLDADGSYGVVDVGYSATIQKMMQVALGRPLTGFYMTTLDTAAAVEKDGGSAFGCFSAGQDDPETSSLPVLAHALAVEAFLTAPHGQVVDYDTAGGRIAPLFKADPRSPAEHAILSELHAGAEQYITETLDLYGADLLKADIASRGPQEFLRMLMEGLITTPSEPMRALGVEDDFCGLPIHKVYANP
ncbi:Predicted hydrolase, HAD superfamily [Methylobacterium phyllostachyos]|uniref:Predicted hydrolase, HAD superfamily n=1 Tax=Methylobacterium phyllostachyos TaxID=582672 RepID=A0A1H0KCE1_9HYPH|nr:rhamnan synthesis F family protein [Methylobacterium phyllostachyos]SDO53587.1 Predicted hydrolase, HAD superfamily [Methylobacterium phyllostachyos]